MAKLNIGLIGVGRLGRVYARDLWSRIACTRLTAIADPDRSPTTRCRTSWNVFATPKRPSWRKFARNVLDGREPPVTIEDGIQALRIAVAATRARETGLPLQIASVLGGAPVPRG
jgi:predicted dehydrogenase